MTQFAMLSTVAKAICANLDFSPSVTASRNMSLAKANVNDSFCISACETDMQKLSRLQ